MVKSKYGSRLSWADLIVLAGTTALEDLGALPMQFCPGRSDMNAADSAVQSKYLNEGIYLDDKSKYVYPNDTRTIDEQMKDTNDLMGFSLQEMAVLNGGGHSIGNCHAAIAGFDGAWTNDPNTFDNSWFKTVLQVTDSVGDLH
eukprot:UN23480